MNFRLFYNFSDTEHGVIISLAINQYLRRSRKGLARFPATCLHVPSIFHRARRGRGETNPEYLSIPETSRFISLSLKLFTAGIGSRREQEAQERWYKQTSRGKCIVEVEFSRGLLAERKEVSSNFSLPPGGGGDRQRSRSRLIVTRYKRKRLRRAPRIAPAMRSSLIKRDYGRVPLLGNMQTNPFAAHSALCEGTGSPGSGARTT